MTSTEELQQYPAIARYLSELASGLATLPAHEREAIVADVSDHIAAEVDALPRDSDAHAVDLILERLGSPAAMAAEASGAGETTAGGGTTSPIDPPRGFARFRLTRGYAAMTILILALGGIVVPILGWLAGVVFLWISSVWTVRDKVLGTLILPGGFGRIVLIGLIPIGGVSETQCSGSSAGGNGDCVTVSSGDTSWVGLTILIVLLVAQVLCSIHLYRSFSKRTPTA